MTLKTTYTCFISPQRHLHNISTRDCGDAIKPLHLQQQLQQSSGETTREGPDGGGAGRQRRRGWNRWADEQRISLPTYCAYSKFHSSVARLPSGHTNAQTHKRTCRQLRPHNSQTVTHHSFEHAKHRISAPQTSDSLLLVVCKRASLKQCRIQNFTESQRGDAEMCTRSRFNADALPETVTGREPAAGK